jgi:hypothetical protein
MYWNWRYIWIPTGMAIVLNAMTMFFAYDALPNIRLPLNMTALAFIPIFMIGGGCAQVFRYQEKRIAELEERLKRIEEK